MIQTLLDVNAEKKTDFKTELFELQEQQIFEVYWLCKTHPQQNTASNEPKITS